MTRLALILAAILSSALCFMAGWAFGFWDWGRDCVPVGPVAWRDAERVSSV